MAGGTDGQIITYDASGDPKAIGPGTAGQVLTSAGAGAEPAFATPAAGVGGAAGVDFNDDVKVRLGTGNDLKIYHENSSTINWIEGPGKIKIQSSDNNIELNPKAGETGVKVVTDGAVELYHNNAKKLETKSDGIKVTGLSVDIDADSAAPAIFSGDSNRTGAGQHLAEYRGDWNGTNVARMVIATGDDTTNKDEGMISLQTHAGAGAAMTERVKITHDGHVWTNKTKEMFWYKSPTNASTSAAIDSNGILIFGSAIQSNGGVYNSSNGRFTAPITGVYFFFFNGLIDNNSGSGAKLANLYKNGSNMNTICFTNFSGSDYMGMSGCGVLNLVKDDYVQIWAQAGLHTAGETNFGGYLVG